MHRNAAVLAALLVLPLGAGCTVTLAASPRIYTHGGADPYASVPPPLRSSVVPLLYATDRKPDADTSECARTYTFERSRRVAFGEVNVEFGEGLSWDALVEATRTDVRKVPISLRLDKVVEVGQMPETTYEYDRVGGVLQVTPTAREETELAERVFLNLVESRLAASARKDIFFFVHGFANSFQDAAFTMSQVWHFLGREGVPFIYTWPAGSGGLLRGYTHDRESGEFTVFHLKSVLRLLARARGLHKIHVIAHSRGTDVYLTALREIFLQDGRRLKGDCFAERLGTVVLAAPDIDFDVLALRVVTEGLFMVPERMTIYVSEGDRAIGLSNWLFTSLKRLGRLSSADLSPEALERLSSYDRIEVVDARVYGYGSFGHDYFYSHPAVSSDLIRLLREGKAAGSADARPLRRDQNSFWILENDYLEKPKK